MTDAAARSASGHAAGSPRRHCRLARDGQRIVDQRLDAGSARRDWSEALSDEQRTTNR